MGGAIVSAVKCPGCSSLSAEMLFDYRYNVEWDRHLLEADSIYRCENCRLVFAWPMPTLKNLNNYYTNVYRASGRPHWAKEPLRPTFRHLAYLSYLTHHVNLNETGSIFEIGAGWGEIGSLLKNLYPHLMIHAIEPDKFVREHLKNRGYTLVETPESKPNYDVILSFHSLEHFTNPRDFFSLTAGLKKGGYLMLEVPNCDFEAGWHERVYDSPHLLFFTKSSLVQTAGNHGFREVVSHISGQPIEKIIKLESQAKAIHGEWTPSRPNRRISTLSRILSFFADAMPEKVVRWVKTLVFNRDADKVIEKSATEFDLSSADGWVIRGLFQKLEQGES